MLFRSLPTGKELHVMNANLQGWIKAIRLVECHRNLLSLLEGARGNDVHQALAGLAHAIESISAQHPEGDVVLAVTARVMQAVALARGPIHIADFFCDFDPTFFVFFTF